MHQNCFVLWKFVYFLITENITAKCSEFLINVTILVLQKMEKQEAEISMLKFEKNHRKVRNDSPVKNQPSEHDPLLSQMMSSMNSLKDHPEYLTKMMFLLSQDQNIF